MENHLDTVTEELEDGDYRTPPKADYNDPSTASSTSSASFRDSKISFAVDISGSTYGEVLDAEKQAILSICSLVPRNLRSTIRVLPWSDAAEEPKSLSQLSSLVSDGGTDPNVFIQHPECRYALQQSSFWFLMTDGLIKSPSVRRFASGLLEYGLHGTACVIAIFGDLSQKPSECNITVGLSVFAVSPHTAFLYTDVESGNTFVLQSKGCFSALLPPGRSNPTLDYSTSWDDLPQISFENLSRISIPPPQTVGKDEVILNDSSKLDVANLLQNLPEDDDLINQILDNEDNLKTIALTAKVTNQSDRLRTWLDRIDHKLDTLDTVRPPPQEQHSQLLADVFSKLCQSDTPTDLSSVQQSLQKANEEDALRRQSVTEAQTGSHVGRRVSSDHARRISYSSLDDAGNNISGYAMPHLSIDRDRARNGPSVPSATSLFNPGFYKSDSQRDLFKGRCNLCAAETSVMALLLRAQPEKTDTPHFPAPGTRSKLIYPLTMGNYPETDIVSSFLACDPCSYRLVQRGRSPQGETLVSALPMVSFIKNKESWLETINVATHKRFHQSAIPMVFLSILYTKLERGMLEEDDSPQVEGFREAIKWVCNMLLSEVLIARTHESELDRFGVGTLHEVLLRNFRNALDDVSKTAVLEYPLDGFIVANVALSNSKHKSKISGSKRKRIVFLRFLSHLAEKYYEYVAENGKLVIHAAKALVLLLSDPVGPRSLLRWDTLRGLSVSFKNPAEMRQFFSQMGKKSQAFKLSISIKELTETPFLSLETMHSFQRLGVLFNWISSHASHATAAFLHHLLRSNVTDMSVQEHFGKIVNMPGLKQALSEPENLSARAVEEMIKGLPPMELNDEVSF